MIDLHCHSTYSDGLLAPALLFERAQRAGIRMLALTDHDTVAGMPELIKAAVGQDIQIIPGIELSVQWRKYDIHILGLNIDIHTDALQDVIARQQNHRILRGQTIGAELQRCGIVDAYAKACHLAGHIQVGRAHFAQVLLQEGIVRDMKSAFKTYLGKGKVAYVPATWINLSEAVSVIRAAGGQAVIAHPMKYKLTRTKLQDLVQTFEELGGAGVEVISGEMVESDIDTISKLCNKFSLLASSGSDFHGEGMSRVALGRQKLLPNHCTPIWHSWAT